MGDSSGHGEAESGSTCGCCWEDLSAANYVEYRASAESQWLPSKFCEDCVGILLASQFDQYRKSLSTTTCKAEQRRLLEAGPPINLKDKTALPTPDDGEVYSLWYASDGCEHSAKLEGSLEGEERKKFWDEQKDFVIKDEKDAEEEEASTGDQGSK